jgi:hypothetical protein
MGRSRYWKLTPDEVEKINYPEDKLLNWDMKCIRKPEDESKFIGVFQYRHGTPMDYTPVKGIVYFHNNISRDELPKITKFLKNKFGGDSEEKGERVFLKNSKEIFASKDIASLAKEIEKEFNTSATITLEFEDISEEDLKKAGLPEAKLLPIPGK